MENARGVHYTAKSVPADAGQARETHIEGVAMRELISREPWWANAPRAGQDELELEWGYLEIYKVDGKFDFQFLVTERPSVHEIVNRKGCRTSELPA